MELMIDFTCPRCHQIFPHKFSELTPGQHHLCPTCRSPQQLTGRNLQSFKRNLETYCRP